MIKILLITSPWDQKHKGWIPLMFLAKKHQQIVKVQRKPKENHQKSSNKYQHLAKPKGDPTLLFGEGTVILPWVFLGSAGFVLLTVTPVHVDMATCHMQP